MVSFVNYKHKIWVNKIKLSVFYQSSYPDDPGYDYADFQINIKIKSKTINLKAQGLCGCEIMHI